ncbi:MAG: acetate/propionate family kinase [Tepidisphaeraceae bacterium]|jgi:acetate kinase
MSIPNPSLSPQSPHILSVNGGSSSIKFALFESAEKPRRILSGQIDRIGQPDAALHIKGEPTAITLSPPHPVTPSSPESPIGHAAAAASLINFLDQRIGISTISGIGHRIVHGGSRFTQPAQVTAEMLNELRRLIPLDPAHLPEEIELIEGFAKLAPHATQVGCFDTAFHADMPRVATLLSLPRKYQAEGLRRYGFHGLSYTYLMGELSRLDPRAAAGKVVLAHLGSGASLAAVENGRSIDTTMAFTPTSGLVMSTRGGDIDPGVAIYFLRNHGYTADQLDDLFNRRSGLLGLSETTPDMQKLLTLRATDPRAADAVDLFCYTARKKIAAASAALGGLQTLIFSGGIGEHAPQVRSEICQHLSFIGVNLDPAANAANAAIISTPNSPCTVRVIATDEESVIAEMTQRILAQGR